MLAKDLYEYEGNATEFKLTGWLKEGDGGGGLYKVAGFPTSSFEFRRWGTGVPLKNGRRVFLDEFPWYTKYENPTQARADVVRRGFTYRDEGGTDLVWEGTGRAGPLWGGTPVHKRYSKPHPITCSHFIGMLMMGWAYGDTTYVRDTPRVSGWSVPLDGLTPKDAGIWQAHRQAMFLYKHGWLRFWEGYYESLYPGDIVFFSQLNPENSNEKVLRGETDAYWGNVYHVALYLREGTLLQAATPESPTGVYETPITESLKSTLTFVSRPPWVPPPSVDLSVWDGERELVPNLG